jgi:hypothetical protein
MTMDPCPIPKGDSMVLALPLVELALAHDEAGNRSIRVVPVAS